MYICTYVHMYIYVYVCIYIYHIITGGAKRFADRGLIPRSISTLFEVAGFATITIVINNSRSRSRSRSSFLRWRARLALEPDRTIIFTIIVISIMIIELYYY